MDLNPTSDTNDSSRASAELKITRMPGVIRKPMPSVSDMEIYLRLNVPDGLESNGQWPYKYGIVQEAHADAEGSILPHNDDDPLAVAKGALARADAFTKSATIPAKKPSQTTYTVPKQKNATPPSSGPTLADELAAKRKNVEDYAGSY